MITKNNLFEINHVLVFHKVNWIHVINNKYMNIYGGDYKDYFGSPLETIEERLNYLWQGIWDLYKNNKEELNSWKEAIHFYCPNAILYNIEKNDWYGIDNVDSLQPLFDSMKENISILKYFLLDTDGYISFVNENNINEYDTYGKFIPQIDISNKNRLIHWNDTTFVYEKTN